MAPLITPIRPGYICPKTGRVAVLAAAYAGSELNGEVPVYWYSQHAEDWGLDPWRQIAVITPRGNGQSFDVRFADGSSRTVGPLMTVFAAVADACRVT